MIQYFDLFNVWGKVTHFGMPKMSAVTKFKRSSLWDGDSRDSWGSDGTKTNKLWARRHAGGFYYGHM